MSQRNDVVLGDSFQLLKTLEDGSFDLILTDPPYNISRPNNFQTMGREGFSWGWDQEFDTTGWIEDAVRLLRPGGSIIVFNDWKLLGEITAALVASGCAEKDPIVWQHEGQPDSYASPLIWEKNNPQPRNIHRRYVSDKEFAVWAVKPKAKWTFNKPDGVSYARGAFHFPVPRKRKHPTKKPDELFEQLVRIHSNPGDWVLDPFAGEGTTSVAAKRTGRNSLVIDKSELYYEWAVAGTTRAKQGRK